MLCVDVLLQTAQAQGCVGFITDCIIKEGPVTVQAEELIDTSCP